MGQSLRLVAALIVVAAIGSGCARSGFRQPPSIDGGDATAGLDSSDSVIMGDLGSLSDHTITSDGSDDGPRHNYRSIGVHSRALHDEGVATVIRGERTIRFSAVSLPTNVGLGDELTIGTGSDAEVLFLHSRDSDGQATLQAPATRSHSAAPFAIRRAFRSLAQWEESRQGDLVAEQRREIGVCYHDGVLGDSLLVAGSTTDDEYYMHVTVAQGHRHVGVAGTGVILRPDVAGHAIEIRDHYTRIEGLEITGWSADAANSYDGINIQGASSVLVDGVMVYDDQGQGDNPDCNGIALEIARSSAVVRNSMVYNISRGGIIIQFAEYASLVIQNSTVWNCVLRDNNPHLYGCVSIREGLGAEILAENVIAMGSQGVGDFSGTGSPRGVFRTSSGSNLSSDDTAPGAESLTDQVADEQFVSLVPEAVNLHLKAGADAIGAGLNLSAGFQTDIDGQQRSSTGVWDIGADER